jgi:hypothetical protein
MCTVPGLNPRQNPRTVHFFLYLMEYLEFRQLDSIFFINLHFGREWATAAFGTIKLHQ